MLSRLVAPFPLHSPTGQPGFWKRWTVCSLTGPVEVVARNPALPWTGITEWPASSTATAACSTSRMLTATR